MSARIAGIALWLLAAVAVSAQAQTVEYLHTDALGSVVAVTDANRTVLERREYEPYGSQLTPAVSNGPGYTGHVQDAATSLVYMQQRYYDAQIGRFLSVDPVAASIGANFNRYAYAANNPYRFTDPDGRDCKSMEGNETCATGAIVGAAARAGYVGMKSDSTRAQYQSKTAKLDPTDSAGRSAVKAEARANTPTEVKAAIEAKRPGLGPKAGSGGTANSTNKGVNQLARNLGTLGKASAATVVLTAGADIATSDNPAKAATANVGAIAGGLAGGKAGATLGALGGPVAWITAPAGGLIGAAVGGIYGYSAGEQAYDAVTE